MTPKRPPHKQAPVNECGSCVKIDSVLRQHQRRALGQPLTGAAIAAAAGISRQKTLVHVRYLIECGWLEVDGRTPVEPCPATPTTAAASHRSSPLEWATDLPLSCRTCGRIMVVLASQAGGEWHVQLREVEIAAAIGISERVTREHIAALSGRRPHARHALEAPLLRGERIPETGGRGGLQWVFLDGKKREGSLVDLYTPEEYRALRNIALDVLAQAPLITAKMNARERTGAAELLVIPRLHIGYPPAEILDAMTYSTDHEKTVTGHAYGLIRWRLDERAPLTGYVAKAQESYDPTPVVRDCAGRCGGRIKAPKHITHCEDCRLREAAGISIDVVDEFEARRLRALRLTGQAVRA
ncbi:hypothetical protein [Streptomyces sp. NBC_01264]|uniref:hypothetical protein n=1 Tax=Streptomyces sp. NBC_01264 TaxID=2903804 RepID=UPI00225C0DD4|nr:hypothetical protein [Streptomyces sp. NBC_01264]MCX4784653.1 hypothetical protein [Streptomyces sp. NBC_01264]